MSNSWVYTDKRNGWVDVEDTTFINFEDTQYGGVMYFEYQGQEYSSHVVYGVKPGD